MQNFLFGPRAGEKERHTAERHHPDGVSGECNRHEPAQFAHFANVLFVMTSVDHRTGAQEQQRFEKAVRQQMHYSSSHAAYA